MGGGPYETRTSLESLQLRSELERAVIPVGKSAELYARLDVKMPKVQPLPRRLPLNVSFILDRSGSMRGEKLEYVKEAVKHTFRELGPSDFASVITYNEEVDVLLPAASMTEEWRERALERVDRIWAGGRTNLSLGWFTGCSGIADLMESRYTNRALLLTDGLANDGITDVETLVSHARELRLRGITTTAFGVGYDFNHFLLQRISDAGGGHFYFIDDPEDIPRLFHSELGEMLAAVARDIAIEIGAPAGGDVDVLNDYPIERTDKRFRVLLGDACAGESRSVVLRLKLPAFNVGQHVLLPVTFSYQDMEHRRRVTVDEPAIFLTAVSDAEYQRQRVNESVLRAACRCEVDRAEMEALYKEYQGDVAGADASLRSAEATISGLLPPDQAHSLVEEIDRMSETIHLGMTDALRKAEHYRTHRSQRARADHGSDPSSGGLAG